MVEEARQHARKRIRYGAQIAQCEFCFVEFAFAENLIDVITDHTFDARRCGIVEGAGDRF